MYSLLLQIAGLQKELESQDGHDEKTRVEISSYRSRISELQSQINKLTNQVRGVSLEYELSTRHRLTVVLSLTERQSGVTCGVTGSRPGSRARSVQADG